MAIDRENSPYRRGNRYEVMPIPMVQEHCIPVNAGAVQLVVESRRLTNEIIKSTYDNNTSTSNASEVAFDDFGASLHVCGTVDRLEYLRFDCFENEPHYHYIDQEAQANTVVRIDELAVGDPIEFSLACVEHHLPSMLRNCEAAGLANDVAAHLDEVTKAIVELRELMHEARQRVA